MRGRLGSAAAGAPPCTAVFRFYAELNDFLPPARRQQAFDCPFHGAPRLRCAVAALGVPPPEVDLVLVNGAPAPWERRLADGDRVAVYPVFESFDIAPLARLRPQPLRRSRFVLDVHLGRLARALRLLGLDARWANDLEDDAIIALARDEGRIILTRDRRLLTSPQVTHGYWVRATARDAQVAEVLARFDLGGQLAPFTRCLSCNGALAPVPKAEVADRLPSGTRRSYTAFRRCGGCGKVYWEGAHWGRLTAMAARWAGAHWRPPRPSIEP